MRAVVQRVSGASVAVGGQSVGHISRGLLALVGIESSDQPADRAFMADKLLNLRIFEDAAGKMNLSLLDLDAPSSGQSGLLLVPNFTLAGDARKGRRPSFDNAMKPELAEPEFNRLVADIRAAAADRLLIQTGIFRAEMTVTLANEGPVTIVLDSREPRVPR